MTFRHRPTPAWLLAVAALSGCIAPGPNSPIEPAPARGAAFPRVVGINLEGREITLPDGFEGRLNLVAVAFEQDHQRRVDTWIVEADRLRVSHPDLRFYEVPTIYEANPLFRLWVNNGMRSGIPDPEARRRTITLYVDRDRFRDALDIPDLTDIHVFLVDGSGRVRWRAAGPANPTTLAALDRALAAGQTS